MLDRRIPKIKIKLFQPGKQLVFEGDVYTVENVCVRGSKLLVKFKELSNSIDAETIDCEYSEVDLNRVVLP